MTEITVLPSNRDRIKRIYHLSDFHIRLLKKHDEYRDVFSRFMSQLEPEGSMVVVTGDVLHSKTELTPECVQITRWIFSEMSQIAPVIAICGTHDANLNNKSRLDSLTPLLSDIPDVYYLNTDGHYQYANIVFGVTNIHNQHPVKALSSGDLIQVALFHGDISSAQTHLFAGYQLALLGKSHEHKFLADGIASASSFIQQDHSEPLTGHGYIVWDLDRLTGEFHEMENDYGYQTVKIKDGLLIPPEAVRSKPRLRFEVSGTNKEVTDKLIADFCRDLDVQESLVYRSLQPSTDQSPESTLDSDSESKSKIQSELASPEKWLEKTVPPDQLSSLLKIHEEFSALVPENERPVHTDWNLVKLEFSGMFCYPKRTVVDFTEHRRTGISAGAGTMIGIFGRNHSGKSSLIDVILYCLFDKCSRGEKKEVLNCASTSFQCRLTIEISGEIYQIERIGKKNAKTKSLKVDVTLMKMEKEGGPTDPLDLSGADRNETNKKIVSLIGTYDDLVMTAVSLQNQSNLFIEMTQSGRKKLLNDLMRLDFYEKLHERANAELREITTEIKVLNRGTETLEQLESKLETLTRERTLCETQLNDVQQKFDDISKERDRLFRQLQPISHQVPSQTPSQSQNLNDVGTLEELRDELAQLPVVDLESLQKQLEENETDYQEQLDTYKSNIAEINAEIKLCNKKKITLHRIDLTIDELQRQREDTENSVAPQFLERELAFLTDLKTKVDGFDDDDLLSAVNMIDSRVEFLLKNRGKKLGSLSLVQILTELKKFEDNEHATTENSKLDLQIESLREELRAQDAVKPSSCHITALKIQISEIKAMQVRRTRLTDMIESFDALKFNEEIDAAIRKLDAQSSGFKIRRSGLQRSLSGLTANVALCEHEVKIKRETMIRLTFLQERLSLLKLYTDNVHKDGIPYLQLKEIVPLLEQRINEILSLLTDFTLEIQMDGKDIDIMLSRSKPITHQSQSQSQTSTNIVMASGFEKFISSLAIRIALMDISLLPKPRFIIIDEGFGAFDADNLSSVDLLFDYLKLNFNMCIIISHIDSLKNEVHHVICPDDLKRKQSICGRLIEN